MTRPEPPSGKTAATRSAEEERKARLAAQLRANLQRRKAQARALQGEDDEV